jgi:hypothetical protein
MLSAEAVCRVKVLEAAHTTDATLNPAMILLQSIVQLGIRPVPCRFAERRANGSWVGAWPSVVTRSGTNPIAAFAERKNLLAAAISRVEQSMVSTKVPSPSITRLACDLNLIAQETVMTSRGSATVPSAELIYRSFR